MTTPSGNIVVTIESLLAKEANRKPGFLDACKQSAVKFDEATGLVEFTPKERDRIKRDFALDAAERKRLGLGDIVASVATPIARALGMDCIDKETHQLKPASPCQKRKEWLNSLTGKG